MKVAAARPEPLGLSRGGLDPNSQSLPVPTAPCSRLTPARLPRTRPGSLRFHLPAPCAARPSACAPPSHGARPAAQQPGPRLPVHTRGGDRLPEGVPPARLPPKLTRHMRPLIPLSQNPMRLVPPTSQTGGRTRKPQATGRNPRPTRPGSRGGRGSQARPPGSVRGTSSLCPAASSVLSSPPAPPRLQFERLP